ncbi:N-formylglutamate amidohydrolase [Sphingomonas sp. BE138]|uniref:N-formylglutamate amidohydrolase n=1 Tax=Sphingomonas sp. BE138 TaxID=2817845 RepID=UPI00285DE83F|nr:N-formylglutamate amidohydrolase [Sphingomonas sp. BE138]MDR6788900.1 N-formylglutamate amidohydrolase [Sphingomonas sp. BE138]
MTRSFDMIGDLEPVSPVVLSVPHAGRDYPPELRMALRAPLASLAALEDRYVDTVALAARRDETLLLQRRPRAWIDLNRAEHERDPLLDDGACRASSSSAKVRAGIGLVPRRTAAAGELWRCRLSAADVEARIAADHRPYHDALARLLEAARARFGCAVLLDVHSMPPIAGGRARVVIGDRFGRAAAGRFVARVEEALGREGLHHALNTPYAGGHILERHAIPQHGVHAIQLEIDRGLYLDRRLDQPGSGMAATARMLRAVIDALAEQALADGAVAPPFPIADAAE